MHESNGPVLVLHREGSARARGNEVDLACRKVGHVRIISETESVALLSLLFAKIEVERQNAAGVFEIDLHPICTRHSKPQFLRLGAHLAIVNRQPTAQDRLIQAVESRSAKAVFFRLCRQRSCCRKSRDAQNDVVNRIDIAFQTDLPTLGSNGSIGQVEIAPASDLVGKNLSALQVELLHRLVLQSMVEIRDRISLDREVGILQKLEVDDVIGILKINEDADLLACLGFESAS